MKKKSFILIVVMLHITTLSELYSQDQGLPYIKNFSSKDYEGGPQNWSIAQDSHGVMFFGNSVGVLEYDGTSWRVIPITNRGAVRSLARGGNDMIYVGAKGDFGLLEPDTQGLLYFKSLLNEVDSSFRNFNDVWDIVTTENLVYFCTYKYVFVWDGQQVKIIFPLSSFHRSFEIRGQIYVKDAERGLFRVDGTELIETSINKELFSGMIYVMLPWTDNEILIGTRAEGLQIFDGSSIRKFNTDVDEEIANSKLYCAIVLPDKTVAIGTLRNGIFIVDKQGKLKMKIDKASGLQNNVITHFLLDQQSGLWVGLNDGIARLEISSPFTSFDENSGINGIITSITRYRDQLYIGTIQGLQVLKEWRKTSNSEAISTVSKFETINGIETQVWHMLPASGSLLIATTNGVYDLNGFKIDTLGGAVSFFLHQSKRDSNRVYVGTNGGVNTFYKSKGIWLYEKNVEGIHEEIRTITEVNPGEIWFGTAQTGAIKLNENEQYKIEKFNSEQGLPKGYIHVHQINGEVRYATFDGIYYQDTQDKTFKKDLAYGPDIEQVSLLNQDKSANITIIFSQDEKMKVIRGYRNDKHQYIYNDNMFVRIPQMNIYGFFIDQNRVTWLGGTGGLIRFDSNIKPAYENNYQVLIRKVVVNDDSLIYAGTSFNQQTPSVSYEENNIRFEFSATSYDANERNQFKYILEGFDKKWSEWTQLVRKEYTNIPEGSYTFKVIAKNAYHDESEMAEFEFEISPPWYRSLFAYLLYSILLALFIIIIVRLNAMRLRRKNEELEQIVESRTKEITEKNALLQDQTNEILKQKEELVVAADGLKIANDEISSINASLEHKIVERTSELEDKNQKLSDYAFTNAHELRAPVANLLGLVNLFDKERTDDEVKEYIAMLKKVAIRLDEITYEIRDRLESEGHKMND